MLQVKRALLSFVVAFSILCGRNVIAQGMASKLLIFYLRGKGMHGLQINNALQPQCFVIPKPNYPKSTPKCLNLSTALGGMLVVSYREVEVTFTMTSYNTIMSS